MAKPDKPPKPYLGFPLFAHATGRWAKKIRGKLVYFGPWANPDAALSKYLAQRDDLQAGRTPRPKSDGLTIEDLLNHFLTGKRHLADAGEIRERTFQDHYSACVRIGEVFGLARIVEDLGPEDFEQLRVALAKKWGPAALGNEIQRARVIFNYASAAGLVDKPVRFGPGFKKPSKKVLRLVRAGKGKRLFEPAELRALAFGVLVVGPDGPVLVRGNATLRAMVLLGINCGFGNTDVGRLPMSALDLASGWVNYPRPKTGIGRRCPLWPETVEALKAAIRERKLPKDQAHADLVFVTYKRGSWAKDVASNPVSDGTWKLLRAQGVYREGLNFYALRHTFETIGGESRDQVAVDAIMGHTRQDMASLYREKIGDDRLLAVTNHIHAWLFPKEERSTAS